MNDLYKENNQDYRYISRMDPDYPEKLSNIKDPPAGIYVRGSLPDPNIPSVAIVGSRICSQYGRLMAEQFGETLAKNGVQIISGLARGIDGISQLAAVNAGGRSFGILGCGVLQVYPASNSEIYKAVLQNGGLISEFRPDAPPINKYFIMRNRIISALADIVLIVEAKEKSGTQITVNRALEQGKDIYAIPGRVTDICSQGCNKLIAQGAGIATSPETVLNALGIYTENKTVQNTEPTDLEMLEKKIYAFFDYYPVNIDSIASKAHLPIPELLNIIFHLQMKGYIRQEGRGYYVRMK